MKILKIGDAENVTLGLQDEIRRSEESRYDHRLHGVLLVAQGMNCSRWRIFLVTRLARSRTGSSASMRMGWPDCRRGHAAVGLEIEA